jgi:hypothetical protein
MYCSIIVPSLASWAGLGGIGILLFGLYETFKDYKNTNSDLVDYDYTITDSKTDNSTKNDFNDFYDDDSTEDEYYKYKYHVTKYQFRLIVGILVIGILVISVLSTLLALIIVILVFIIIKLHNSK